MHRRKITRRHALKLGAAAVAASALRPPSAAAACRVPVFEVDLAGWRTLPVRRAPRRFDMLGLRWSGAGPLRAEIRARRRNGSWTPWTALHAAGDHAPDGGRVPAGTEPCWTGAADFFQVRVQGRPRALRARFVRAQPTAALARRTARRRAAAARASQGGAPAIILRPQWGGDSCPPRTEPSYGQVQVAFVHHTVTANDYRPEDSAGIVLGICRYHRDTNKWNDVGYNFLVDRYGQIFEGRAGGIDQAVIGAQAQGYNSDSTGIAYLGDFSSAAPPAAGMEALARLIAWKLPLHGAPVSGEVTVVSRGGPANRYPAGQAVTLQRISGHRDGDSTACPGDALYAQLPALRERAAALAAPVAGLSLRAAKTTVRHPSPVSLSGTLRFDDGADPAGSAIQIQFQTAGAAWEVLATVTAGAGGAWSAKPPLPGSGLVRAVFPGDGTHASMAASPVRVRLLPRLTLSLESNRVARGNRVEVEGTLGPTWPSRVEVVFERQVRGRWRRVQRKRVNVRRGRYRTVVRPTRTGLHRVTVRAPGAMVRRRLRAVEVTGGASAG